MNAQLGDIQFRGIMGFQSFTDNRSASYAEHPLLDGKSRLQRTGDELQRVSFTMTLHESFTDPRAQFQALEGYRVNGEVLPLVDGLGQYVADFVIDALDYEVIQTGPTGSWVAVTINVSLVEYYVPNRLNSKTTQAKRLAFARAENSPLAVPSQTPRLAGTQSVDDRMLALNAEALKLDADVNQLSNPSRSAMMLERAKRTMENVRNGISAVEQAVNRAKDTYNLYQTMSTRVQETKTAADRLRNTMKTGNADEVVQESRAFRFSMQALNSSATPSMATNLLRK